MQEKDEKTALIEAVALLEPADLAAIADLSLRLAAWSKAKKEARVKYGTQSEQHKKAIYHLRKIRNRIRQGRVGGGAFFPVDWIEPELAQHTKATNMVEVH